MTADCCCGNPCCPERCNPYISELHPGDCTGAPGENPLPQQLTVECVSDSPYGCFTMSCVVDLISNGRWGPGRLTGTCDFCCPWDASQSCTWTWCADVFVQCSESGGWLLEFNGCGTSGPLVVAIPTEDLVLTKHSCNPILLTGTVCYFPGMFCVASIMPPLPPVEHPTLCLAFTISEVIS